jgi:hypothetical protein
MAVQIGDIVRLTAKMKLFGTDDVMNIFHYEISLNDTLDDLTLMEEAALLLDIAYTHLINDLTEELTFVTIDGQNITQNTLLPEVPWPVLVNGDNAASLLPTQCAAEVFWPTTTPKVRTTCFVGGYAITANDALGAIAVGSLGRLADFGAQLTEWTTANVEGLKGSFNVAKDVFTPAGSPVVPTRWRTQRRRRLGVGS